MAEGSPKDGNASKEADSSNEGGLWSGIKSLLFGENAETSLRRELEEALRQQVEQASAEAEFLRGQLVTLLVDSAVHPA